MVIVASLTFFFVIFLAASILTAIAYLAFLKLKADASDEDRAKLSELREEPVIREEPLGELVVVHEHRRQLGPERHARRAGQRAHVDQQVGRLFVGQRERVVVVEIGSSWLVVGVAPGSVNLLQQMPRAEMPAAATAAPLPSTAFATWLKQVMEKRNDK